MASMIGVEKIFDSRGVVAPLGEILCVLSWRCRGRRSPDCEPRGWRWVPEVMFSWSDEPCDSRKKGRGRGSVSESSVGEVGHDSK